MKNLTITTLLLLASFTASADPLNTPVTVKSIAVLSNGVQKTLKIESPDGTGTVIHNDGSQVMLQMTDKRIVILETHAAILRGDRLKIVTAADGSVTAITPK